MESIDLKIQDAVFFAEKQYESLKASADAAVATLEEGSGAGNDFLGWLTLPDDIDSALVGRINATAERLREHCDYVVCIGIGGSYLGAKAVISALSDSFADYYAPAPKQPKIIFAGQNIGEEYIGELQSLLKGKRFGIIVISKSGHRAGHRLPYPQRPAHRPGRSGGCPRAHRGHHRRQEGRSAHHG